MKTVTHLLASGLLVLSFYTTAEAAKNQQLHLKPYHGKVLNIYEEDVVEAAIKYIVIDQLGVEPFKVTYEASFVDDLGADDLDLIELFNAVEDEFLFEIPDEDRENITTVGDLIEYVRYNWY